MAVNEMTVIHIAVTQMAVVQVAVIHIAETQMVETEMTAIYMAEVEIDIEMVETAAAATEMTVMEMTAIEMDAAVANSIAGGSDLMAPQKAAPALAVVDPMIVDVLFATAAIAREEDFVLPIWKREKSAQERETVSKDPLALFLFCLQILPLVYQFV